MFSLTRRFLILSLIAFAYVISAHAQTTAFNYQGQLTDGGNPANGSFQMQFKLFDASSGGAQIGSTLTNVPVTVTAGTFSTRLDFGAPPLNGANRWLEIAVRRNAGESYVTLSPREQIASSPYAVRTLSAAMADDSQKLGGVAASEYVTNTNAGTSFIRNQIAQQTGSNFNISGNGVIGGNLGVGNNASGAKFSVTSSTATAGNNTAFFDAPAIGPNASNIHFGTTGDWFIRSANSAGKVVLQDTGGNVGIGTNAPATKLSVLAPTYGISHTDGTRTLSTFMNTQGGWFGTRSNHPLFFYTNDGAAQVTLNQSGQLGVGTTAPLAGYLADIAGPVRSFGNTTHFVAQTTGGTNSWARFYMRSTNRSWFVGTSQGFNGDQFYLVDETANIPKVTIQPGFGPMNLLADVTQSTGYYGAPKAMLFVQANGTIARCYNGVTGATSGGCGFIVGHPSPQTYDINLGFPIAARFMSLTSYTTEQGSITPIVGRLQLNSSNANVVSALFWITNTLGPTPSDFYLIVY